jgi:16S rRNA (guanine527-N7)-methyltransferase
LLRWNARVNLTAVRDPGEIVTRHFGESFFLVRHLFPMAEGEDVRVLDVGSGAGFPGLPLKIWAPAISLTLVESNHKKAAFLREVARAITLTNVNVTTVRAQTLVTPAEVVTLRAVERFDAIVPVAASLVAPGGRLVLLVGADQASTLPALAPRFQWAAPIPIPLSRQRVLSLGIRH